MPSSDGSAGSLRTENCTLDVRRGELAHAHRADRHQVAGDAAAIGQPHDNPRVVGTDLDSALVGHVPRERDQVGP